jgi:dipeptidyl aminopeptidase/acylaminoacyl peptidase
MNAEHFTRIKFLSSLSANPSATQVAYVLSEIQLDKNRYQHYIHLHDGQHDRRMTHSGRERTMGWIDDDHLFFVSDRDEEKDISGTELYRLALSGGEAQLLAKVPLKLSNIRFLKDGSLLAVALYHRDHPNAHRYTQAKREALRKRAEKEAFVEEIDEWPFYANGDTFTVQRRARLVQVHLDPLTITPLTPANFQVQQFELSTEQTRVFILGHRFEAIHPRVNALYALKLKEPKLTRLSKDTVEIGGFDLFGEHILALVNDRKLYGMNQNSVLAKLETTGRFTTVYDPGYSFGNSINSDMRLFGSKLMGTLHDRFVIHLTVEDHSRVVVLDENLNEQSGIDVAGSCDGLALLKGELVMIAMIDQQLQELWSLQNQALTQHNAALGFTPRTPHPLHTQVDGRPVEGWVLLPEESDQRASLPTILVIHGGPKTVYGSVYTHEHQLWAEAGYAVVYCNPLGSDGRGNAFADIRGAYGSRDFDDLMGFLDAALAHYPQLDPQRCGVIGGSYGGYMTNWITSHTSRFKAAVTQRSICNWTSFYGVSDIGYFFVQDQVQADLHNPMDFEKLWDNSPLKYVRNVQTPTLVIHSKLDYRCPIDQGYQWYSSLKLLNVPTKLWVFHDENHDLTRSGKPQARLKSYTEILAWFDQYLR